MTTETVPTDVPRETFDPIETARVEVRRLREVELDLAAKRDAAAVSLPSLEAGVGDAVLDGGDAGEIGARIAGARAEVEVLDRAIAAARDRRVGAIQAVFAAEADELRRQAAAKRDAAELRRAKTEALLRDLEEHEGLAYAPIQPDRPTPGAYSDAFAVTRRATRTGGLLIEAEDLERRAIAERSVTQHGRVEADSVEALIAEATADPMHIGPTIASMRAWADEGASRIATDVVNAQARFGDREAEAWGNGRPVRFELYWGQGVIDAGSSRVFAVSREPTPVMTQHGLRYDRTT